jgi:hypothetical protein
MMEVALDDGMDVEVGNVDDSHDDGDCEREHCGDVEEVSLHDYDCCAKSDYSLFEVVSYHYDSFHGCYLLLPKVFGDCYCLFGLKHCYLF